MPECPSCAPGVGTARNWGYPCVCDRPRVLFWLTDSRDPPPIDEIRYFYESCQGYCCHTNQYWTGNIRDYDVVFWPCATRDPVWMPQFLQSIREGSIFHITAEHGPAYSDSIFYVNQLIARMWPSEAANPRVLVKGGNLDCDCFPAWISPGQEFGTTPVQCWHACASAVDPRGFPNHNKNNVRCFFLTQQTVNLGDGLGQVPHCFFTLTGYLSGRVTFSGDSNWMGGCPNLIDTNACLLWFYLGIQLGSWPG